jgi:hypothetical protein
MTWRTRLGAVGRFVGPTLVTFLLLLGIATWTLRSAQARGGDLPQDYTSAKALLAGESPYQSLRELLVRHGFIAHESQIKVGTNPHPPGAILLTLPYAGMDFETALTWVRWTQLLALAVAWSICFRLFRPPLSPWLWAAIGGAFALWSPVWQGLDWGQPIGLLALVVAGCWALVRSDRPILFGLLLGFACTVRPFLAVLAVVAAGWSPRRQAEALGGAIVGGLVPFAVCGIAPWEWYRLAADAGAYVGECGSLPGVLGLGTGAGVAFYAGAAVVIGVVRWRGMGVDSTIALAAVAGLLTYPLAWFQYDVSLVPVLGWLGVEAARTRSRVVMLGLVGFVLLRSIPDVTAGSGGGEVVDALARAKGWLQVAARGLLLATVVAATRRVSACAATPPRNGEGKNTVLPLPSQGRGAGG